MRDEVFLQDLISLSPRGAAEIRTLARAVRPYATPPEMTAIIYHPIRFLYTREWVAAHEDVPPIASRRRRNNPVFVPISRRPIRSSIVR